MSTPETPVQCPQPEHWKYKDRRAVQTCPQEIRIHDVEGSDERQWEAIKGITRTLQLIQAAQQDFVRRLDVDLAAREAATKAAEQAHEDADRAHYDVVPAPAKDAFLERMKDLTYELIKYVAVGLLAWALMKWGGK